LCDERRSRWEDELLTPPRVDKILFGVSANEAVRDEKIVTIVPRTPGASTQ
jgi:hypothetical protein